MVGSNIPKEVKVYCTFQHEGWHTCPLEIAREAREDYLAHLHRHMFHVKVTVPEAKDRGVEFIRLRRAMLNAFSRLVAPGADYLSCEELALRMIFKARRFLDITDTGPKSAITVEVSEDGENGAIVTFPAEES